jgi:hypothetical protein
MWGLDRDAERAGDDHALGSFVTEAAETSLPCCGIEQADKVTSATAVRKLRAKLICTGPFYQRVEIFHPNDRPATPKRAL